MSDILTSVVPNYREADICQYCKNFFYAESTGGCFNVSKCRISGNGVSETAVCDKFKERKK